VQCVTDRVLISVWSVALNYIEYVCPSMKDLLFFNRRTPSIDCGIWGSNTTGTGYSILEECYDVSVGKQLSKIRGIALYSSGSISPGRVLLDNAYDTSKSRELFTQLISVKSQETWIYVSVILPQSLGWGPFHKPAGCMSWPWIVNVDRTITIDSLRHRYLIQQLLPYMQFYPGEVSFRYRTP
jgi:hypothetical protein